MTPPTLSLFSFLGSVSHIQQDDDHVCSGITKDKDYVNHYNLVELTQNSKNDILQWYEFQGADDKLVKSVLSLGITIKVLKKTKIFMTKFGTTMSL